MKKLKVVHLNTYDGNGGAGRACSRLNEALNQIGIDSKILVLYQSGDKSATTVLQKGVFGKLRAIFNILAERYLAKWMTKANQTPFSLQWFGQKVSQHPLVQSADIIHLHWINHGFLTPKILAQLEKLEKPIFWTFHDSNAFTGGCHVRYECENFYRNCGKCPQLKFSNAKDLSHKTWKRKQKAYSKLHFQVIAPSRWMAQSVKASSLMAVRQINIIPNTINSTIFKPYNKIEAKKLLNISSDKFVIISGFMPSKNDKHKGTPYLVAALEELAKRPGIDKSKIELIIFGNKDNKSVPEFPFSTKFLGTITKDEHLAKCYSAADVFVAPSLEDNLPNTVMEALACATPVVAFRTGGIPDMVNHLQNGYLAAYKNSIDLAEGIEWIYFDEERNNLQKMARKTILDKFELSIVAQEHLELYSKSIIY